MDINNCQPWEGHDMWAIVYQPVPKARLRMDETIYTDLDKARASREVHKRNGQTAYVIWFDDPRDRETQKK